MPQSRRHGTKKPHDGAFEVYDAPHFAVAELERRRVWEDGSGANSVQGQPDGGGRRAPPGTGRNRRRPCRRRRPSKPQEADTGRGRRMSIAGNARRGKAMRQRQLREKRCSAGVGRDGTCTLSTV